jgi:chaperonin cofactor prefoldin
MLKTEILNRKLETLERQELTVLNNLERVQKEIKSANDELSYELNRKKNNYINRQEHYQKMLQNIAKDRADAEAELNQIASDGKQKETNKTSKFG